MGLPRQIQKCLLSELLERSLSNDLFSSDINQASDEFIIPKLTALTGQELGSFYVKCAMIGTGMDFLSEHLWLKNQEEKDFKIKSSNEGFILNLLEGDLSPLSFLKEVLLKHSHAKNLGQRLKRVKKIAYRIEIHVLSLVKEKEGDWKKNFLKEALNNARKLFIEEEVKQSAREASLGHCGMCLYRTFDRLDEVFGLDYQQDKDMLVDNSTKERLYQKSGVGVQSGFSSIILALENCELKPGHNVIDLGSGYGRVGLVCALLRPDVDFVGYEYVQHRVDISNQSCEKLGLEANLSFKTQDLSLDTFIIPDASAYYLYDPFTEETYRHVLAQIIKVSQRQKVIIVTKGNARNWLMDIAKERQWPEPVLMDEGNLCIFKSA